MLKWFSDILIDLRLIRLFFFEKYFVSCFCVKISNILARTIINGIGFLLLLSFIILL